MARRKQSTTAQAPSDHEFEATLRRLVGTPTPVTTHRWSAVFKHLSDQHRYGSATIRDPLLIPLA